MTRPTQPTNSLTDQIRELQHQGFCVLRQHFARHLIEACRDAFWPVLLTYLKHNSHQPNRAPHRHFLSMPFEFPYFVPDFFFDKQVFSIVHGVVYSLWAVVILIGTLPMLLTYIPLIVRIP